MKSTLLLVVAFSAAVAFDGTVFAQESPGVLDVDRSGAGQGEAPVESGRIERRAQKPAPLGPRAAKAASRAARRAAALKVRGENRQRALERRLAKLNRKHLIRLAKFERIESLAEDRQSEKLSRRVQLLRDKEAQRHRRVVGRLEQQLSALGATSG